MTMSQVVTQHFEQLPPIDLLVTQLYDIDVLDVDYANILYSVGRADTVPVGARQRVP